MIVIKQNKITFNKNWINKYESIWCILEKLSWANMVKTAEIVALFDRNSLQLKKSATLLTVDRLPSFIREHQQNIINDLFGRNYILNKSDFFSGHLKYCPKCILNGYHSIFHQLIFLNKCPYHSTETLQTYLGNGSYSLSNNPLNLFYKHKNILLKIPDWFITKKLPLINKEVLDFLRITDKKQKYSLVYAVLPPKHNITLSLLNKKFNKVTENRVVKKNKKINYGKYHFHYEKNCSNCQKKLFDATFSVFKCYARFLRKKYLLQHKKCIHFITRLHPTFSGCNIAYAYLKWRMINENSSIYNIHNKKTKRQMHNINQQIFTKNYNNFIMNIITNITDIDNDIKWSFQTVEWIINNVYLLSLENEWEEIKGLESLCTNEEKGRASENFLLIEVNLFKNSITIH
ncbi:hypothetical protein [Alkalihalobacillus sp. 1P02AB]|uniref:hypothetical protein n=1 Tax=Alkalihalobacillus sp. 1P02AB TaxID=3132260 RepID=UPI0039A6DDA8